MLLDAHVFGRLILDCPMGLSQRASTVEEKRFGGRGVEEG
jgi:hypothetical protein